MIVKNLRRWRRDDGSRLVLRQDGKLVEAVGPGGRFVVLLEEATVDQAEEYAAENDYGAAYADADHPVLFQDNITERRRRQVPPRPRPRTSKGEAREPSSADQPEWCAEREARILAHMRRVEREEAELAQRLRAARSAGSHLAEVRIDLQCAYCGRAFSLCWKTYQLRTIACRKHKTGRIYFCSMRCRRTHARTRTETG